jgi:hypothetical protein
MSIDLSQFRVRQTVLELRYAAAFLVWDRSGAIWHEMSTRYLDLQVRTASPNIQSVRIDSKNDATVQINTCNVTTAYPSHNLDDFKKLSEAFFPIVISKLEIEALTRIGFRVFFEKKFKNREDTATFAVSLVKGMPSGSKYCNIEGRVLELDHAVRWEGEARGCMARIRTANSKLEVEIPVDFDGRESIHEESNIVQVDVDFYTILPTVVGKFDGPTIIGDWFRLIRRDVPELLNG